MTISIIQATSNARLDVTNAALGTSAKIVFYTAGDVEVATCPYSAALGTVSTSGSQEIITWAAANFTDDTTRTADAISYAMFESSTGTQVIKFTDPVTELGLSSLTGALNDTVSVTTDVVYREPAHHV